MKFHYNGVVSAKGKLHIATNRDLANGSGGTNPRWIIDLDSLPVNLQHIEFLGKHPPYKLIVTYGDPDEGAVMMFRNYNVNSANFIKSSIKCFEKLPVTCTSIKSRFSQEKRLFWLLNPVAGIRR